MNNQYPTVSAAEQKAIVGVCILAAFADGAVAESERQEVKRVAENFSSEEMDVTGMYQQALAGKQTVGELAKELKSANSKALAYEMALCICEVDEALNGAEQKFLGDLRQSLGLDVRAAADSERLASTTREQPPVIGSLTPAAASNLDEMIRDRAILTGALELMPQRLATMAIIPIQMRLVYQIGKNFGYDLDLNHTKEFFATVGVGLASQVVEGYVSKLVGTVARRVAGRFVGGLASQATESALAFATTYALGQAAKTYYQSGRTLSTGQLRELFSSMLNDGRSLQSQYTGEIARRAGSLRVADFVPLIKS